MLLTTEEVVQTQYVKPAHLKVTLNSKPRNPAKPQTLKTGTDHFKAKKEYLNTDTLNPTAPSEHLFTGALDEYMEPSVCCCTAAHQATEGGSSD